MSRHVAAVEGGEKNKAPHLVKFATLACQLVSIKGLIQSLFPVPQLLCDSGAALSCCVAGWAPESCFGLGAGVHVSVEFGKSPGEKEPWMAACRQMNGLSRLGPVSSLKV